MTERRRNPRTEVLGQLRVQILSAPAPAVVREISLGGFSLETEAPPPAGVHRFVFQFEDMPPVETVAESVHASRVTMSGGATVYVSGYEFLPCGPATSLAVAQLIDRIAVLCTA